MVARRFVLGGLVSLCMVGAGSLLGSAPAFAAAPETPETLAPESVTAATATFRGVLNPHAAVFPLLPGEYEFLYKATKTGTQAECESAIEKVPVPAGVYAGLEPESISSPVEGLTASTDYVVCLRAVDSEGATVGTPVTFTTPAAAPSLLAGSEAVTEVTATSAILNAEIASNGAETTYRFEYGTTAAYGQNTPEGALGASEGGQHVATIAQGLQPGTVYHYRVVASNALSGPGGTVGPEQTFTTQNGGSGLASGSALPDGRQYEMVTPPQKEGTLFRGILSNHEKVDVQASAEGNAFVDQASQPSEHEAQGNSNGVSVFMARGLSGWASQVIAPPHSQSTVVSVNNGGEYRIFSEDLSHGVMQQFGNFTPLSPEAAESTPYLRTDYFNDNVGERCEGADLSQGTCFEPLVTRANTKSGTVFGDADKGECALGLCGPFFVGGTPDLSHIILDSRVQLTTTPAYVRQKEVAESGGGIIEGAFYEWSGGKLQLIDILPGAEEGRGLELPATGIPKHIVSNNGGRIIMQGVQPVALSDGELFLRDVTKGETIQLNAAEPGCGSCVSGNGSKNSSGYQTANNEASRIFFISDSKLTRDSGAVEAESGSQRSDLYECAIVEAAGKIKCDLSDLTPESGGEAANVQGVLGSSEDGSYVYFTAGGALASGASADDPCYAGASGYGPCNLYVLHEGVTSFIAELSGADLEHSSQNPGSPFEGDAEHTQVRASPDGRWLAFMSNQDLTGYDTHDAISGTPDEEAYLYDASSSRLTCASCNPTGARPVGAVREEEGSVAALLPGWYETANQVYYQPRYLSDSGRLFFDSQGPLVPRDVSGAINVYEYEPAGTPAGEHACSSASESGSDVFKPAHSFEAGGRKGEEPAGCVALISSGTSPEESTFLDASETGSDAFFLTTSKLAPQDFDRAYDVYDAQECTTAAPCVPVPAEQPPPCEDEGSCRAAPAPQPAIYGAPSSETFDGTGNLGPVSQSASKPKAKKLAKCKKGFLKRKGKCVKARHKKAKKAKRTSRMGNDRRSK